MVASVSNPASFTAAAASAGRPAGTRVDADDTSSVRVSSALRREIAVTAKFGPDPVTGSPFRVISGEDVEAAETNDLQRLSEANLGLVSPQTSFQAQSIRSDEDIARENQGSQAAQAAQQSLEAGQSSFSQIGGTGSTAADRGISVDVQV
tara:strand:+ start:1417 stop:1866 length:450 start_codon:yes stop_codon:yes gene_type:complete